jgi:transcriptional regulator with XRE-family HTH domain
MEVDMRFTEEICQSIGRQLRGARKAKGHTQKDLAKSLGVSRRMVMKYEQGKVAPTGENLARAISYVGGGLDLPGYEYKLTAQALERPKVPPARPEQQLELPLGVPQSFPGTTVRITRTEDSIEIFAVVGPADRG